jgi:hypothetical protein
VPILRLQNEAFVWPVQGEVLLLCAIVIINITGALDTNSGLDGFFMAVPAPGRIIDAIDIKDPFQIEGNYFLYYSEISPFICKSFQVN